MSTAVYCPNCPDQLFPDAPRAVSEPSSNALNVRRNLLGGLLEATTSLVTKVFIGKDFATIKLLNDLLNQVLLRHEQGEEIQLNYTAFHDAIQVLLTLPRNTPMPTLDIEESGDILMEWYKDRWNIVTAIVDGKGVVYYAGLFGNKDDRDSGRKPITFDVNEELVRFINRLS